MKAAALVLGVEGGRARLECDAAAAACLACAGRGGCALQRLAGRSGARLEVPALDADGRVLVPGARVTVEIDDGELLGAAARTYLPPVAGVLTAASLAAATAAGHEALVLLAGLAGLGSGWAVARAWLRRSPPRLKVLPEEAPGHVA
jgi:positive regulator of sigma E activity